MGRRLTRASMHVVPPHAAAHSLQKHDPISPQLTILGDARATDRGKAMAAAPRAKRRRAPLVLGLVVLAASVLALSAPAATAGDQAARALPPELWAIELSAGHQGFRPAEARSPPTARLQRRRSEHRGSVAWPRGAVALPSCSRRAATASSCRGSAKSRRAQGADTEVGSPTRQEEGPQGSSRRAR